MNHPAITLHLWNVPSTLLDPPLVKSKVDGKSTSIGCTFLDVVVTCQIYFKATQYLDIHMTQQIDLFPLPFSNLCLLSVKTVASGAAGLNVQGSIPPGSSFLLFPKIPHPEEVAVTLIRRNAWISIRHTQMQLGCTGNVSVLAGQNIGCQSNFKHLWWSGSGLTVFYAPYC